MSVTNTNPATLFGGTWVPLENRFLLGAGSNYTNGSTGGNKDAVVVEHDHTQKSHNHSPGDSTYNHFMSTNINIAVGSTKRVLPATGSNYYYVYSTEKGDIAQPQTTDSKTPIINSKGIDGTDKNMPPYLVVYMWKRTA